MNNGEQFFNTAAGGYAIQRSLRFSSADSSFLSRTPASAGDRRKWTFSCWMKLSGIDSGAVYTILSADSDQSQIMLYQNNLYFGTTSQSYRITSQVFRDPSAWQHLVVSLDTTNATAANRVRIYVNGSEVTAFGTNTTITQNQTFGINDATLHRIGHRSVGGYFSGYLADCFLIDSQALDPTAFGEFSATTGVWVPKAYTGSYGTNGFHLDFADNSAATAAALGKDTSGNGNNWLPNNISTYIGYSGTISATGTNSQPTYQSTGTYSSYLYTNSFPAASFGGSTDARPYVSNYTSNGGTYYCTWFPPGLTFNKSLRIFCLNAWNAAAGGTTYRYYTEVNGKKPSVGSGWSWVDYSSLMTPGEAITSITAFTVKNSSDSWSPDLYWPAAIEIDGYILVSGAGLRNITTGTPSGFVSELRLGDSVLASGASSGSGIVYSKNVGTNSFVLANPSGSWASGATLSNNSQSTKENDSLLDVPTNGSEVDTGLGGQVRGNYCTLNALTLSGYTSGLENGNLYFVGPADGYDTIASATIAINTGKWYWEVTAENSSGTISLGQARGLIGIKPTSFAASSYPSHSYASNGQKFNGATFSSYGAAINTGDIIGVALDLDAGTLTFYKNGVSQGTAFTSLALNTYAPCVVGAGNGLGAAYRLTLNFGQRPFAYPVAGYKCLNTASLPASVVTKPSDLFQAITYTGNGSARSLTTGFSPDLVWVKARNDAYGHRLLDTVRGVTKPLVSSSNGAEITESDGLTAFNSDGFSLGTDIVYNQTSYSYAAWCWDAGSSTVTNTQGSITSQVRANASAGFSIVTYTGTGTANSTFGHGLGVAPSLIITKNRGSANDWYVYHASLGAGSYLVLNSTSAAGTLSDYWSPVNSTVFGQTYTPAGPNNGSQVAYCFAPVVGYSSMGSFIANGSSDGVFQWCGFRPRFLLLKCSSVGDAFQHWHMFDSVRNTYNQMNARLQANSSAAEDSFSVIDFTSNGFKLRYADAYFNQSGATYVWAAFAESPFAANNRAR